MCHSFFFFYEQRYPTPTQPSQGENTFDCSNICVYLKFKRETTCQKLTQLYIQINFFKYFVGLLCCKHLERFGLIRWAIRTVWNAQGLLKRRLCPPIGIPCQIYEISVVCKSSIWKGSFMNYSNANKEICNTTEKRLVLLSRILKQPQTL